MLGAGSEAGPLTWLAKWKANIVAIDLPRAQVWERILNIIEAGNATLIAPSDQPFPEQASISELKEHLGANLLTQLPEIGQWLVTF